MNLREAWFRVFGHKESGVSSIERAIIAHALMLNNAIMNGGVVTTEAAQAARELLGEEVKDPKQAAIDFFQS